MQFFGVRTLTLIIKLNKSLANANIIFTKAFSIFSDYSTVILQTRKPNAKKIIVKINNAKPTWH